MINISFFFAFMPAFGMKYLISPMLSSVYDASSSTQNLASFLFLFIYANGRFWFGYLDRYFNPIWTYRFLLVVVAITYPILAVLAKHWDHDGSQTGFIVCQCIVGFTLGAKKVMWVLLAFKIFGAPNLTDALSITTIGGGLSGVLGPVEAKIRKET